MNGLMVLRQIAPSIDPNIIANLRERDLLYEHQDGSIWVDNDQPWDATTGAEIVKNSSTFIVADVHGGRLAGPYRDLQKAETARVGAKVQFVSVVEDLEDEPEDELPAEAAG